MTAPVWNVYVSQLPVPPDALMQFYAVGEVAEAGKRWGISAEGRTAQEAVSALRQRIKASNVIPLAYRNWEGTFESLGS